MYFEVSASCSAFSSSALRASSISRFLLLDLAVLLGEQLGLLLQLLVGLLQLFLLLLAAAPRSFCSVLRLLLEAPCWSRCQLLPDWLCSSSASACDCLSSSSVRMLAAIVLSTMPMLSVSWSRNVWWISLKRLERGQLDHRLDLALEQHRQHDDVAAAAPRPGPS